MAGPVQPAFADVAANPYAKVCECVEEMRRMHAPLQPLACRLRRAYHLLRLADPSRSVPVRLCRRVRVCARVRVIVIGATRDAMRACDLLSREQRRGADSDLAPSRAYECLRF